MLAVMSTRVFLVLLVALGCGGGDDSDVPGDGMPDSTTSCTPVAGAAAERVITTSGPVHGTSRGETWAYLGVPYAAPPVGDLRFRAPASPVCSPVELDASALGPKCPQLDGDTFVGQEDCLVLNVWAPRAPSAARPVMVWIHGGANIAGSATDPTFDGQRLAEAGDVLVVSINYRLGQLGFLADSTLAESGSVGNYAVLDHIAALSWVHDNIAAFGGDPANVTVFGESAGGRNTCTLLATPASAGLFHRAIVESGACKFLDSKAQGQATADAVVEALGCTAAPDRPACLRAASAEAVTRAAASSGGALESSVYGPVIDGVVLPEQPEAAIRAGRHHAVPVMIGANADETGRVAPIPLSEMQYQQLVQATFGAFASQVLQHYPSANFPSPRAAYVRLTTDQRFVCPSREIAADLAAHQDAGVYRYFFRYGPGVFGAVHGIELPYVFGTFDTVIENGQPYTPTAADLALSAAIQGAWTRFARTGDPAGTPAWPRYDATDPVLVLDDPLATATAIRDADCDFWKPIYDAL